MKRNNQVLLLIAGIAIAFSAFISLQILLGLIAVSIIIVALIRSDQQ